MEAILMVILGLILGALFSLAMDVNEIKNQVRQICHALRENPPQSYHEIKAPHAK
jgi:hypothetical protein